MHRIIQSNYRNLGSWVYFQGVGPGGASFRVRDIGADPTHRTSPGELSTAGRKSDNGDTAEDTGGWGLGIPTADGSDGGCRL